jgi:hypothetical protein
MLNLNNNRLISTYNQSFFTESMVSIMAGYLMLELIIHYSFVKNAFCLEQNEDKIKGLH